MKRKVSMKRRVAMGFFAWARAFAGLFVAAAVLAPLLAAPAHGAEAGGERVVRVLCLKGPTGMGLARLMEEAEAGRTENRYEFQLAVSPEDLMARFVQGAADVVAMPSNMAAILWNRTQGGVRVLSASTLGVLAVVEKGDAIHGMGDLRGRTILASGRGASPEYVLSFLLRSNGLEPGTDCKVEWLGEHAAVVAGLAAGKGDAALLPHPFVEAAAMKVKGLREALDLTEEWRRLDLGSELVMAVNAAGRDYVDSHGAETAAFLREARSSAEWVNAHPAEAARLIVKHEVLEDAGIAERAIPRCGITALAGAEMRRALSGYLKVLFDADPRSVGGVLPDETFYYAR